MSGGRASTRATSTERVPAVEFSHGVAASRDGQREVGQRPWNMALTADGAKLYVANGRSNSVSVIDTRAGARPLEIRLGESPWGVAVR